MFTIFKENTIQFLITKCSVLPEDGTHIPKRVGLAHLMFVLIKNVYLFGIINGVRWYKKCTKWTTLKRHMLSSFHCVIRNTLFRRLRLNNYLPVLVLCDTKLYCLLVFFIAQQPLEGQGLLGVEVPRSHCLRYTTIGRTPLDDWSARRKFLFLTIHNTYKRQTSVPPTGSQPAIPAS